MKHIHEIEEGLSSLPQGTVIFIDVDDTLITPDSVLFRANSPYKNLIDELKKNWEQYPNFETILSRWRLQRKTRMVDSGWLPLIQSLKERYPVYALTKMETGAFGEILSMEDWRYRELTELGFSFTPTFAGQSKKILLQGEKPHPAIFCRGIFITGSYSKGEVLKAFFKAEKPAHVVLIDDRLEHIHDVEKVCHDHQVPYLGILYTGLDLLEGVPLPAIAELQKRHLFEQAEWIEDERATAMWQGKTTLIEKQTKI